MKMIVLWGQICIVYVVNILIFLSGDAPSFTVENNCLVYKTINCKIQRTNIVASSVAKFPSFSITKLMLALKYHVSVQHVGNN